MKVLIVVDMQNDFISGALGTPEAREILPRVREELARCRAAGWQIAFTQDTHAPAYLQTQEGKRLPIAHCVRGTWGWEIDPSLDSGDARIFEKPTFGSVALGAYCQTLADLEEIELIGLCTDICVLSNAVLLKAFMPEVQIAVKADCCAGATVAGHETALDAMRACQIDVI